MISPSPAIPSLLLEFCFMRDRYNSTTSGALCMLSLLCGCCDSGGAEAPSGDLGVVGMPTVRPWAGSGGPEGFGGGLGNLETLLLDPSAAGDILSSVNGCCGVEGWSASFSFWALSLSALAFSLISLCLSTASRSLSLTDGYFSAVSDAGDFAMSWNGEVATPFSGLLCSAIAVLSSGRFGLWCVEPDTSDFTEAGVLKIEESDVVRLGEGELKTLESIFLPPTLSDVAKLISLAFFWRWVSPGTLDPELRRRCFGSE